MNDDELSTGTICFGFNSEEYQDFTIERSDIEDIKFDNLCDMTISIIKPKNGEVVCVHSFQSI